MTIKKNGFEKFAFLPKVCVWCNRKFIFEEYFIVADQTMAIPEHIPHYTFCKKCLQKYELPGMVDLIREETINFCLPKYLRR